MQLSCFATIYVSRHKARLKPEATWVTVQCELIFLQGAVQGACLAHAALAQGLCPGHLCQCCVHGADAALQRRQKLAGAVPGVGRVFLGRGVNLTTRVKLIAAAT